MKKYIPLLLLLLSVLSCRQETKSAKTDAAKANLKGPVYEVKETSYTAIEKSGEYVLKEQSAFGFTTWVYNLQGYLTQLTFYDDEQNIQSQYQYTIENNELVEGRIYQGGDKLVSKSVYERDSENRISEVKSFDATERLRETTIYTYLSDNEVSMATLNSLGETVFSSKTTLKKGREVKYEDFGPDGILRYSIERKYNKAGEETESTATFSEENFQSTSTNYYEYEYDSQNNWIKKLVFDSNRQIEKIVKREITYH